MSKTETTSSKHQQESQVNRSVFFVSSEGLSGKKRAAQPETHLAVPRSLWALHLDTQNSSKSTSCNLEDGEDILSSSRDLVCKYWVRGGYVLGTGTPATLNCKGSKGEIEKS